MYKNTSYENLNISTLFLCIIADFIELSNGKWHFDDLLMLQAALSDVGIDPKSNFTLSDFSAALLSDLDLCARLLNLFTMENELKFQPYMLIIRSLIEKIATLPLDTVHTIMDITGVDEQTAK